MKQIQLATLALITNTERSLLVRRAREPFKDYWAFVSGIGAFEYTSDPREAVKMEVKCDIGCDFSPSFFNYFFQEPSAEVNIPTIIFAFYGNVRGIPKLNSKYVSDYRWFSSREIKKMKLAFIHNEIFDFLI